MISYLHGKILSKAKSSIVVLTSAGIGYQVHMPPARIMEFTSNQDVELFTYMRVTDQSHDLFGFKTAEEKQFFELLLTVSGVGPKSAMNVLTIGSIDQIKDAIARQDVKYLTAVQGMGKKTAERLVVELKSKVEASTFAKDEEKNGGVLGEVVDGLVALGYSKEEARSVVQALDATDKTSEQLLKKSLQLLAK